MYVINKLVQKINKNISFYKENRITGNNANLKEQKFIRKIQNFSFDLVFKYVNASITPAGIYLLKVNNRNTRTRCEICSKLTVKIPEQRNKDTRTTPMASFWYLYC